MKLKSPCTECGFYSFYRSQITSNNVGISAITSDIIYFPIRVLLVSLFCSSEQQWTWEADSSSTAFNGTCYRGTVNLRSIFMSLMECTCIYFDPTRQPAVFSPSDVVALRVGHRFHVPLGVSSRVYKQCAVWNNTVAQHHSKYCSRGTNLPFLQRILQTEQKPLEISGEVYHLQSYSKHCLSYETRSFEDKHENVAHNGDEWQRHL